MQVKVVGCHCHKCKTLQHNVRVMARKHGWHVTIQVEPEPNDLPSPALFINDELVSTGRALSLTELESLWVIHHD